MNWNNRLDKIDKQIPPARHMDPMVTGLLEEVARIHGGTWENGRLTSITFVDGVTYQLGEGGAITPDLARAMLRAAGIL